MNSLLRHALSHPIYSLVAALLTGFVSAWLTPRLFYDAHHGLTWFDIGLFLPIVLIAASAKASNDLTNRNRQIALYLAGYLSLIWYQAPETGVQIFVKGAIVAIVLYAVVRSSTPIKESKFDLVVTDIFMPNLDGYRLTSGLREIGFTGPIIGVSAATIGEERDRLIEAGASAALAKPISVEKLTQALQSIDQSI